MIFSITDPYTKKETVINIYDIVYVEEGKNAKYEDCIWIKMKDGQTHSFKMKYDAFIAELQSMLVYVGFEGLCIETMKQKSNREARP